MNKRNSVLNPTPKCYIVLYSSMLYILCRLCKIYFSGLTLLLFQPLCFLAISLFAIFRLFLLLLKNKGKRESSSSSSLSLLCRRRRLFREIRTICLRAEKIASIFPLFFLKKKKKRGILFLGQRGKTKKLLRAKSSS